MKTKIITRMLLAVLGLYIMYTAVKMFDSEKTYNGSLVSDERNKENIDTTFVPELLNIKLRTFNMKNNPQPRTGVIAQELLKDSTLKKYVITDDAGYHQVLYIDMIIHELVAQRKVMDSLINN